MQQMSSTLVDERLSRVAALMPTHGLDAVLVTPGPDLRYLKAGYDEICVRVRVHHEAGEPLEGHSVVAGEVAQVRTGSDEHRIEPVARHQCCDA